jgi:molybdopterin adenylyltransferase
MSSTAHRAAAPAAVRCFVITVSDTRTEATDTGGRAIIQLLTEAGHIVEGRRILRDEPAAVAALVRELAAGGQVDVIITTGGTGITHRDSTFEALDGLLDKRLPGFGELFRMLSFQEIGAAAMLSRACAGTHRGRVIVSLPGSENAVRLAMTRLLIPELGHLVAETRR